MLDLKVAILNRYGHVEAQRLPAVFLAKAGILEFRSIAREEQVDVGSERPVTDSPPRNKLLDGLFPESIGSGPRKKFAASCKDDIEVQSVHLSPIASSPRVSIDVFVAGVVWQFGKVRGHVRFDASEQACRIITGRSSGNPKRRQSGGPAGMMKS